MHYFDEIKQYVGFRDDDAETLRRLTPVVAPHFPAVVDAFYTALLAHDRTRNVFEDDAQIQRQKDFMAEWLMTVFAGDYGLQYYEDRRRIGTKHVQVGLLPQFMFGSMNVMRIHLREVVQEAELPNEREALAALDRILDIELAIMLGSYWDRLMHLKLQVPAAMASGLAHEIRNPLNAMALHLTLLERRVSRGVDLDQVGAYVESLRSEIQRLLSLTTEMMDFAKPVGIERQWVDIRVMLTEMTAVHGPVLDASRIALDTQVSGDSMIFCDADRLTQVFNNLMTNSVEAMEGGTIQLLVDNTGAVTEFRFSDDGDGIGPGAMFQLFDLFFTTKSQGTGLGLPIVKKIIEAHEGSIDITGRRGAGTTVTIFIPRPLEEEP